MHAVTKHKPLSMTSRLQAAADWHLKHSVLHCFTCLFFLRLLIALPTIGPLLCTLQFKCHHLSKPETTLFIWKAPFVGFLRNSSCGSFNIFNKSSIWESVNGPVICSCCVVAMLLCNVNYAYMHACKYVCMCMHECARMCIHFTYRSLG